MESLSQVLKELPDALRKQMQMHDQSQKLLQHPLIRDWLQEHPELTEDDLRLSMNKLYQYAKEQHQCSHCPGLARCPNDLQGHYTRLEVKHYASRPQIIEKKVSCQKWLSDQAAKRIQSRIHSFYVDEKALNQGYSTEEIVKRDPQRAEAVEKVFDYILRTKKEGIMPKGLYLAGDFGTGKTFLMCYMLHELAKSGYTGAIVYMPDFIEDIKSMIQEPQKLKETIDLLKETDLLIFDDIGSENLTPWLRDHVLGSILNYRMNRKPSFFTSNYRLRSLEKHFSFTSREGEEEHKGKRLMNRIEPFVEEIIVHGENQRGKLE